jgi:hypothetical protein
MEARRLVGRTPDIAEAGMIAEQYQLQGFEVQIIKKMQAGISVYEVWASREPEIKS